VRTASPGAGKDAGWSPPDQSRHRTAHPRGADVLKKVLWRLVDFGREGKVVRSSKLHVGTTVRDSYVHYPTASSLLSDGVSVLTRTIEEASRRESQTAWWLLRGPGREEERSHPPTEQSGPSAGQPERGWGGPFGLSWRYRNVVMWSLPGRVSVPGQVAGGGCDCEFSRKQPPTPLPIPSRPIGSGDSTGGASRARRR
jgi:hypothetical protein